MDDLRHLLERARRSADEAHRVATETKRLVRVSREMQRWSSRVQNQGAGESGVISEADHYSNQILGLLPVMEFARLIPRLQKVSLPSRQVVHRTKAAIDHVYFPISGLLSATICMREGDVIEVAVIGNEGLAGLMAVIGNTVSPYDVVVQVPAVALRMDVNTLFSELSRGGPLGDVLLRYHTARAILNTYQIACSGLHSVGNRCCRRLLDTQDRLGSDLLPLTHESLALTLGVRRATVSEELSALQLQRVIQYKRGLIKILDRPQLQSLACECYQAAHDELSSLFPDVASRA